MFLPELFRWVCYNTVDLICTGGLIAFLPRPGGTHWMRRAPITFLLYFGGKSSASAFSHHHRHYHHQAMPNNQLHHLLHYAQFWHHSHPTRMFKMSQFLLHLRNVCIRGYCSSLSRVSMQDFQERTKKNKFMWEAIQVFLFENMYYKSTSDNLNFAYFMQEQHQRTGSLRTSSPFWSW